MEYPVFYIYTFFEEANNVKIEYKKGDILAPVADGRKMILCNQVNCKGAMGAGFARNVKEKYPDVEEAYKRECRRIKSMREVQHDYRTGLGNVQFFPVLNDNLYIANMFAQNSYGTDKRQTDYDAFEVCMTTVKNFAEKLNSDVVIRIPYQIGCGLAGGDWEVIEKITTRILGEPSEHVSVEIWKQ